MIDTEQPFPEHDPLPDRCLFCGSTIATMKDGRLCRAEDDSWVAYTCLSSVHRSRPLRKHQSTVCHALESAGLRSRITDLENEKRCLLERIKRLEEAGDLCLDFSFRGMHVFAEKQWRQAKEAKP